MTKNKIIDYIKDSDLMFTETTLDHILAKHQVKSIDSRECYERYFFSNIENTNRIIKRVLSAPGYSSYMAIKDEVELILTEIGIIDACNSFIANQFIKICHNSSNYNLFAIWLESHYPTKVSEIMIIWQLIINKDVRPRDRDIDFCGC